MDKTIVGFVIVCVSGYIKAMRRIIGKSGALYRNGPVRSRAKINDFRRIAKEMTKNIHENT
jgi:hypothetical protein